MSTQLALSFDAVPLTCEVQQRYHSIAPCLAGVTTPAEQAQALNLGYSTITRWLREFRDQGMPGLFPESQYPREPYTPERVIVQLISFKCCVPKAGSLTPEQEVGVVLHVYSQALLHWGRWAEVISDHGGQFQSHAFARANRRLGIHHEMYEKGHPWQNLIERQFGIQARIGKYHWERCQTIEAAIEFHRELIRDHNRLPHWAHRRRNDGKQAPLEVLGDARGAGVEPNE